MKQKPPFNPRHPSRKLSPKELLEIRDLLAAGWFQNRIAARYDVNPGRISEIKTGKHVLCNQAIQHTLPL